MADDRLARILDEALAGALPANVALMRLLMEATSADEVEARLRTRRAEGEAAVRLDALRALHAAHPRAAAVVGTVMARARHDAPSGSPGEAVAAWAAVFDDLALAAPDAGVALYGLGSPSLLAAATAEIVATMRGWGLTGSHLRLLDYGCGVGRLTLALAPHVGAATGLDVSPGMVAEARRRAGANATVDFRQANGSDLAGIDDGSVDIVLVADVMPYLVASGPDLAGWLVDEAARVLAPGGALLIFNFSYGGDLDQDARDCARLFRAAGLAVDRSGSRDLKLWDAAAYLGRKPAR